MEIFSEILHTAGQILKYPCIIILIFILIATVWQVGDLIVEFIVERRKFQADIPTLLKKMTGSGRKNVLTLLDSSALTKRQKRLIKRVGEAKELPETAMTAITQQLLTEEEAAYQKNLTPTELIAKLGPMFGLLGTLIPLGPGIIALGDGDVETLSASIGVAFDTTIAGIVAAAVCLVLSHIRRTWYSKYMSANEAITECLLEEFLENQGEPEASYAGQKAGNHTEAPGNSERLLAGGGVVRS